MANTAQRVRTLVNSSPSEQVLWRLSPAYEGSNFIVTSRAKRYDGREETVAFLSDSRGKIISWTELSGGIGETHEGALSEIGYTPRGTR